MKLVDAGILSKLEVGGKSTYYIAHRIVSIIDRVEALPDNEDENVVNPGSPAVTATA